MAEGMFEDLPNYEPVLLSKKGFAERLGVVPGRVSQMITDGLPVEPNGLIRVAAGERWVKDNIDPSRRRARVPGEEPEPPNHRAEREAAEAEIAKLKAGKLAGQLLDRRSFVTAVEARARLERDAWIAWCNRAAPAIVAATGGDFATVLGTLDRLVREQLTSLASTPLEVDDTNGKRFQIGTVSEEVSHE